MAAVVVIYGLRAKAHHIKQPNKSKLSLYKPLLSFNIPLIWLYTSNKKEHFNYKSGCSMYGHMHIEAFI